MYHGRLKTGAGVELAKLCTVAIECADVSYHYNQTNDIRRCTQAQSASAAHNSRDKSEPKRRNAWFELIKLKRHRPMLQRQLGGLSKARQQPQPPQFVAATALIPGADAAAGCRWRHSTSSLVSKAPAIVVHFLFFPPPDTTRIWAERCCQLRGFGVPTFVILSLD